MDNNIYTKNEIKNILEPIFKASSVKKAILYGSYAKDLQTPASDVDIIIDSDGKLLDINFYGVLEEITVCLKKRVDLIEISEINKNSYFSNIIKNEGVIIYDEQG